MSRRLAIWLLIGIVFVLLVAAAASAGDGKRASSTLEAGDMSFEQDVLQDGPGSRVARLPIVGTIVNGEGDPGAATVGGDDLVAAIEAIREDGNFEGIVLEVNTPGGAVLASAEVAEELERARKDDIKVVAWMRDTAASGGYYVSAPADRIVAAPATITGSIGVILQYVNVGGLADKVGVKPVTVKSGKLKDIGSPFRDLTPKERDILQSLIDEAYDDFVEVVAEGRDLPESRVREISDGRIYTGRQAEENGLVDELGTREAAYDAMAKLLDDKDGEDLEVVGIERTYGFFETFAAAGGGIGGDDFDAMAVARAVAGMLAGSLPEPSRLPSAGDAQRPVTLEYRAVL